ncbi:MAG: excinuclease ABC subunit UvrC, partial [Bacteroidia bacterium]|nr:excinuclease ABC subunit UvrC [Bacteroidia bacterium]
MSVSNENILEALLKTLPEEPGVYQYFDQEKQLLYVGKAKNLKKRVTSYFTKVHDNARLRLMVSKIADIKTIKVNTESDALLLENNLIKNLKPRYNINLKDDKTYPWIVIKKERFPRIFPTRKMIRDGSDYFGPYTNGKNMHALLDLIRQTYPLRNCSFDLSKQNIEKGKFRPCLEFHIGNCKAPCADKYSEEDYNQNLNEIRQIIKGNVAGILNELKSQMKLAADELQFEKANVLKEKIEQITAFQGKSTVVHPSITNTDVIHIICEEKTAFAHCFHITNGAIVQAQNIELKKKLDESNEELMLFALLEFRNRIGSSAKELIVPFLPEVEIPGCEYVVPKIGDKKHLLQLCYKNALAHKQERDKQLALTNPEKHSERILTQMKKDLRLSELPRRIEGFDNSNIQGQFAVSAMPVFIDAKPAKKEYRHFNIKTVEGPDDFASMREVIYRRYSKLLEEKTPLPQLIVVDGGKGQLAAAMESLEALGLRGKIAIVGIAKRLEEIYFPNDPLPLYLDKRSETLKVIQHIRDEAHRFGITHHRSKRSRETFKTELNEIKGISDKSAEKLLVALKSVKQVKEAEFEEIEKILGNSKAKLVWTHFHG